MVKRMTGTDPVRQKKEKKKRSDVWEKLWVREDSERAGKGETRKTRQKNRATGKVWAQLSHPISEELIGVHPRHEEPGPWGQR